MTHWIPPHPDSFLMRQSFSEPLYCVYVQNADESISSQLSELLPDATVFMENGGVGLYFNCDAPLLESVLQKISKATGDFPCGLSGPFASRQNALGCYKKAMRACIKPGITPYSSVRFAMLNKEGRKVIEKQGFYCEDFLHKDFMRLLISDNKNGTDYANSLYAYLSCGKNLKEAAASLRLHRNTLNYRIERIKEIFSIDLDDRNGCFELLFSSKLYFDNHCSVMAGTPSQLSDLCLEALHRALWQILGHETISAPYMEAMSKAAGCWCLAIADIDGLDEQQQDEIFDQFNNIPPAAVVVFGGDRLLAAFSYSDSNLKSFTAFGKPLAEQYGCSIIVGQPFVGLDRLDKQYSLINTALYAAKTIHSEPKLHLAEDYMSYVYFILLQKELYLSDYHCDEVIRVMDYDYDNSTELSKSLYVYLSHFMNMKQASDELFVHRNTLEYHIRKIEQMLCAHILDMDLRFEMLCTYRMLAVEGI